MPFRKDLFILVMALVLAGCSDSQGEQSIKPHYRNVSVDAFVEMMQTKDFTLVNTHIPYEGEIPGTDLLIPFNEVDRHTALLPDDKAASIVVYCKAGPMGDVAAERLLHLGYTHVIHFKSGMNGWQKAGRSLRYRSP